MSKGSRDRTADHEKYRSEHERIFAPRTCTHAGRGIVCLKCEGPVHMNPETYEIVCDAGCHEPWRRT